jgi:phthalate 4,5-cis-dihydrodiol dehydrogenase
MDDLPYVDVVAVADIDSEARDRFKRAFPGPKVYDTIEQLANDERIEAVWLATPNRVHAEHTAVLAKASKHIIVQKPMAITIEEAEQMVAVTEDNGVKLITGHSFSFLPAIRLMRQIVLSGELGKLCAINVFAYNDWLVSTRKFEDPDPSEGGGIVYRNAPHHLDCIRLIGGGLLKSIRGAVDAWLPERPVPGYYAAFMEFADGTPVVAVQSAYGYLLLDEFWSSTPSRNLGKYAKYAALRRGLRDGTHDEAADYQKLRIGGSADRIREKPAVGPWSSMPGNLGIMIVSCERGEIRQSAEGLYVYSDEGVRELKLPRHSAWTGDLEFRELYDAVVLGQKAFHDGRWGMATLEAALGLMESARTGSEITLTHQVEMDREYDLVHAVQPEEVTFLR